jgi:hypothetical protein
MARTPDMYAIRIRGRLGATALSAFPSMSSESANDETVLTGELRDQSALFGVLAQIEALGLELIDVRRISPDSAPPHAKSPSSGEDSSPGPSPDSPLDDHPS